MESVDQANQHDSPPVTTGTAATAGESEYSEVRLDEPDQPEEEDGTEPRIVIHENNSSSPASNHVDEVSPAATASIPVTTVATATTATLPPASSSDEPAGKSGSGSGSSSSSPIPASPHKTRFTVTVRHAKECTGDIITYTVCSKRLFDDKGIGNEGKVYSVLRVYEDFEFLDQCLIMAAFAGDGLIIPPLPSKLLGSNIDPVYEQLIRGAAMSSSTSSKSSPNTTSSSSTSSNPFLRSLHSDSFRRDCHMLEQYVNLMLSHPTFGRNLDVWDKFLTSEKPAARIKVGNKKTSSNFSFISKFMDHGHDGSNVSSSHVPSSPRTLAITSASSSSSNSSSHLTPSVIHHHRDCDEFFQHEKDWLYSYNIAMKETLESLNSRMNARSKLSGVLGHLATALTLTNPNDSEISKRSYKFFNLFSNAIQDYQKSLEVMNYNDDGSLSCCMDLWSRYLDAEREMLQRRTCLLIEYESANRNLDKAKGSRRAEEVSQCMCAPVTAFLLAKIFFPNDSRR